LRKECQGKVPQRGPPAGALARLATGRVGSASHARWCRLERTQSPVWRCVAAGNAIREDRRWTVRGLIRPRAIHWGRSGHLLGPNPRAKRNAQRGSPHSCRKPRGEKVL
jgi:hypothetical protein